MLEVLPRVSDTFEEVFEREHAALLRLAWVLCHNADRAEDAVANAFAETFRAWQTGRIDDVGAYLRTTLINRLRSDGRRAVVALRHEPKLRARRPQDFDAGSDVHLAVLAALTSLPPRQRAAVVLRFYEDRPLADVARILDCPIGTAKSLVSRAIAALRPDLEALRHAD